MPKFWKPEAYKPKSLEYFSSIPIIYNFTHFVRSIIQPQTLVEDGMLVLLVVLQGTHLNHSFYIVVAMCFGEGLFHRHCLAGGALVVSRGDVHILVPSTHHCHFPSVTSAVLLVLLLLHHITNVAFNLRIFLFLIKNSPFFISFSFSFKKKNIFWLFFFKRVFFIV